MSQASKRNELTRQAPAPRTVVDPAADWAIANPILAAGQFGYVEDQPGVYKIGDGVTAWNDLAEQGGSGGGEVQKASIAFDASILIGPDQVDGANTRITLLSWYNRDTCPITVTDPEGIIAGPDVSDSPGLAQLLQPGRWTVNLRGIKNGASTGDVGFTGGIYTYSFGDGPSVNAYASYFPDNVSFGTSMPFDISEQDVTDQQFVGDAVRVAATSGHFRFDLIQVDFVCVT